MRHSVLPAAFIDDSLESYLGRHRGGGRAIFLAVALVVITGVAGLPVVRVEVYSRAPGRLRPAVETHEIRAPISAPVAAVRVADNQAVRAGDVLIELRADGIDAQRLPVDARIDHVRRLLDDMDRLLRIDPVAPRSAQAMLTAEAARESAQLARKMDEVDTRLGRATARLSRLERLYEGRHAAFEAVEGARLDVAELRARRALIREQHLGRWERARESYRGELRDLVARREQLIEQRALHSIRAPVTGTVAQLAGVSPGSFLTAGERLMVLSPLAGLVAEVYVESRDIAYVRPEIRVRVQVDAFDPNRWGAIEGRILEVSDDVVLLDRTPVYRVRCSLGNARLRSPDGRVGVLRKGMAVQARFSLGRRSLLELLWHDVRGWLDPYAPAVRAPRSRPPPTGERS